VGQSARVRTRLDREARRRQIVAAASAVLDGRDVAKVTFEEIADAAGVSRALVYEYFGDRQGLLEEVYRQAAQRLLARVNEALASTPGRRAALQEMVRVHVETAAVDLHDYRLACAGGSAPVPASTWVVGTAKGLGGTPQAELLAIGSVAALQAMVVAWATDPKVSREEATDTIAAILWRGLSDLDGLGITLRPWWTVPAKAVQAG
jgi:AcrR family transcriptional regulator